MACPAASSQARRTVWLALSLGGLVVVVFVVATPSAPWSSADVRSLPAAGITPAVGRAAGMRVRHSASGASQGATPREGDPPEPQEGWRVPPWVRDSLSPLAGCAAAVTAVAGWLRGSATTDASHGPPLPPRSSSRRAALQQLSAPLLAATLPLPLPLPLPALAEGDQPPAPSLVFFEIAADGEPLGRLVVEVSGDVPLAVQRFLDLTNEKGGIGYRRSKVDAIAPAFIRVGELPALTYSETGRSPIAGGATAAALERAVDAAPRPRTHDAPGLVSLVVRSAQPREVSERLVARNGEFVVVTQELGPPPPNGSAFCITTAAAPGLDATNVVVGRVVEGIDLVRTISALPVVPDKRGSPFFQAAKALGDKRATVAQKAFGRPYAKVVVTRCGAL